MASKKVAKKTAKKAPAKAPSKAKKASPPPPEAASAASPSVVSKGPSTYAARRELTFKEKQQAIGVAVQKTSSVPIDQASTPYMIRRPTGVIELDIHLGGGFAAGGPCIVGGPYNSGKTWLFWRTVAMLQRIYGRDFVGAIANVETALDYGQAIAAGALIAIPDEVLNHWAEWRHGRGMPDFTSEEVDRLKTQVGRIELITGEYGEQILENVKSFIDTNACSIIAIDSLNALQSAADVDKTLEQREQLGSNAVMLKKFWLQYAPVVRSGKNYTTLYCTQQVVSNTAKAQAQAFMQKYMKDWEIKGGEAAKHFSLATLVMWSGEKIKRDKEVIGKYVNYTFRKGKAGTHDNLSGEFPFYYSIGGVDLHGELIASAMRRGVLVQYGNRLQVLNGETNEPMDGLWASNERDLREMMLADFDFELAVRQEVLASAGVKCLYR